MNIGIFGTGVVGRTLAAKLNDVGHDVMLGTRNVAQTMGRTTSDRVAVPTVSAWLKDHTRIALETFDAVAAYGELIINATSGAGALQALHLAGTHDLQGKIVIDVSNPLDFSNGMPPSLFVCNTDSLAERLQRAIPAARVVKSLNMVGNAVMVDPNAFGGGNHTMFVCGNDESARSDVARYLKEWFGWKEVIDLGDLVAARGMEMMLPAWLKIASALKLQGFGWKIAR